VEPTPQLREESYPDGTVKARWFALVVGNAETRHGTYEEFHSNGIRSVRGRYDQGVKVGVWTTWDLTGTKLFEGEPESPESSDDVPEPAPEDWDEPVEPETTPESRRTWNALLEIAVVLALAWLVPMTAAATSLGAMSGQAEWFSELLRDDWYFGLTEFALIACSIQVLVVLAWIVHRSDLTSSQIGSVPPKFARDGIGGLLLFAADLIIVIGLMHLLAPPGVPGITYAPEKAFGYTLLCISMILNSLAEEFVWRGFLQERLRLLTRSNFLAIAMCSVMFAAYHLYQGPTNALLVLVFAVLMGIARVVFRSIWPCVIAHTLYNILVMTPWADAVFPPAA
jgi:membrane protease YdiL (CAAX protease family)